MIEISYGKYSKMEGFYSWIVFIIDDEMNLESLKFEDYIETGKKDMLDNDIDEIIYIDSIPDYYSESQVRWAEYIISNFGTVKSIIDESITKGSPIDLENNMQLYAFIYGDI